MRRHLVRRVAIICVHFTRNLAYYRAGWDGSKSLANGDFWSNTNSNFVDQVVLHWCFLFGKDSLDKHHWKNVVAYKTKFREQLFKDIKISESEFYSFWKKMKRQRDKFIAHLDREDEMLIPKLNIGFDSVKFYFEYIKKSDSGLRFLNGLPTNLDDYYQRSYDEAREHYESI